MSVGKNIRRRRLEMNMSQQQLADALGFKTRSSIAKIEKGNSNLSQDKLMSLANVLNTSIEYLLTGSGHPSDVFFRGKMVSPPTSPYESRKKKCAAVILAGGRYRVNKHGIPYQFVSVKEKPIIIYTMEAYQRHPLVDEIYVVCADGWEDFLPTYAEEYHISKLKGIIPAGDKGIESVKNAVEWLASTYNSNDILILQEATRPLTDSETISNAIRCCNKHGSAITYTHLEDTTPFLMSNDKKSVRPIDANSLIAIHSPEVYTMGSLKYAFINASKINHPLSEAICAVFMHNIGIELTFCECNHYNLRIVCEEDLRMFKAVL